MTAVSPAEPFAKLRMGIPNASLSEETEAVNAIYGTDVVTRIADSNKAGSTAADDIHIHIVLRLPRLSPSFILSFNDDYPDRRPRVAGTQSGGELGKGEGHHAVRLMQETLLQVWTPGAVCLFDLIEEVGPLLRRDGAIESGMQTLAAEKSAAHLSGEEAELTTRREAEAEAEAEATPSHHANPNWVLSEPITEKKSVFVGRCARVTAKEDAASFATDLLATNKKVAAATHNITAWRIKDAGTGVTVQDCDDDGETAAGGRLLHLMQLMDVWDVIVVVTRWYGGVKLGPDRFRLVNQAAREALVKGGFVKAEEEKASKKKKRKGKK